MATQSPQKTIVKTKHVGFAGQKSLLPGPGEHGADFCPPFPSVSSWKPWLWQKLCAGAQEACTTRRRLPLPAEHSPGAEQLLRTNPHGVKFSGVCITFSFPISIPCANAPPQSGLGTEIAAPGGGSHRTAPCLQVTAEPKSTGQRKLQQESWL